MDINNGSPNNGIILIILFFTAIEAMSGIAQIVIMTHLKSIFNQFQ